MFCDASVPPPSHCAHLLRRSARTLLIFSFCPAHQTVPLISRNLSQQHFCSCGSKRRRQARVHSPSRCRDRRDVVTDHREYVRPAFRAGNELGEPPFHPSVSSVFPSTPSPQRAIRALTITRPISFNSRLASALPPIPSSSGDRHHASRRPGVTRRLTRGGVPRAPRVRGMGRGCRVARVVASAS